MIAITRKRRTEFGLYHSRRGPFGVPEAGLDRLTLERRERSASRHSKAADLNPPRLCVCKQFPPVPQS